VHNKCSANVDLAIDYLALAEYFIHCYEVETKSRRDIIPHLKMTSSSIFNNYLKF
jgi:hypothetical protein